MSSSRAWKEVSAAQKREDSCWINICRCQVESEQTTVEHEKSLAKSQVDELYEWTVFEVKHVATECYRVLPSAGSSATECYRVLLSATECYRVVSMCPRIPVKDSCACRVKNSRAKSGFGQSFEQGHVEGFCVQTKVEPPRLI